MFTIYRCFTNEHGIEYMESKEELREYISKHGDDCLITPIQYDYNNELIKRSKYNKDIKKWVCPNCGKVHDEEDSTLYSDGYYSWTSIYECTCGTIYKVID